MSLINSIPVVHLFDVGTVFRVTVTEKVFDVGLDCWVDQAVDVSASTVMEILFSLPSGKTRIRPAVFTTDGTDGKIEYIAQEGDIDEAGSTSWPWHFSGFIVRPGKKHTTSSQSFVVEAGIPRPMILLTPLPAMAMPAAIDLEVQIA